MKSAESRLWETDNLFNYNSCSKSEIIMRNLQTERDLRGVSIGDNV